MCGGDTPKDAVKPEPPVFNKKLMDKMFEPKKTSLMLAKIGGQKQTVHRAVYRPAEKKFLELADKDLSYLAGRSAQADVEQAASKTRAGGFSVQGGQGAAQIGGLAAASAAGSGAALGAAGVADLQRREGMKMNALQNANQIQASNLSSLGSVAATAQGVGLSTAGQMGDTNRAIQRAAFDTEWGKRQSQWNYQQEKNQMMGNVLGSALGFAAFGGKGSQWGGLMGGGQQQKIQTQIPTGNQYSGLSNSMQFRAGSQWNRRPYG
jgi:hypothetical protein